MSRIFSQIDMLSQDERAFYQSEARRLGFNNFTSFAKTAMLKYIETSNPLGQAFDSIVETCNETEKWLQEIEEPSAQEAEALILLRAIEQLAIRSRVMVDDQSNYVDLPAEMLEPGEEPHKVYRHAIVHDNMVQTEFFTDTFT